MSNSLPTVVMALRIMEALIEADGPVGVTELARHLGIPKARAYRNLAGLREQGYVAQDASTSRYGIGWRLFLMGQQLLRHVTFVSMARPIMEELRDTVKQTVVMSIVADTEMAVLDFVPGLNALEISLRPGTRFQFHTVAQGKLALAFGPSDLLERITSVPLTACTPHTIVDPERLKLEVELVRRRGWADSPEELFTGINAVAAPIFNADGALFGTLAIVGSIHYLPTRVPESTIETLLNSATRISATLGYRKSAS